MTALRIAGALSAALAVSTPALALDADDARALARQEVEFVAREVGRLSARLKDFDQKGELTPEKRIAAGELSLRSRDYERAVDTFNQVLELHRQGKVGPNSHADALFLLGDAYFLSKQPLSAARQYRTILDASDSPAYAAYAGRSLARLVDVSLQTGRHESLDELRERAAKLQVSDPTGSFDYARGKLGFAHGSMLEARQFLGAVRADSAYYHQAQYVLGTILVREAFGGSSQSPTRLVTNIVPEKVQVAVDQFKRVTALKADTVEHQEVIDLAWLAIGRLLYESDAYLPATEAYANVGKSSPHYYQMLYELAWVYVRLGDYHRAERALELLAVAAPDTLHVADGALLRADLMLRSGRFEEARKAYLAVRERFEPSRKRMDDMLRETKDPAIYYDRLVEEGMAVAAVTKVPETVLEWVKEEARGDRVFAVINDVTHARDVLRRSQTLAEQLGAVLSAGSRARAFPTLEKSLEVTVGLANQLTLARHSLAEGLEDVDDSAYRGELQRVRAERRASMSAVPSLPVTMADFSRRNEQGSHQWAQVSQALQRITLEANKLQAVINGLRRVLADAKLHGITTDATRLERFRAEVEANERDLAVYRDRIADYMRQVAQGRVQVGLGDQAFRQNESEAAKFREALDAELRLLSQGQGGDRAAEYARSVAPIISAMRQLEETLRSERSNLEGQVERKALELAQTVASEQQNLDAYTQSLDALDQHARLLVGEVAMNNFKSVRERLRSIVLRSDVGVVQQAWEFREEQRNRLRKLQRARAIEEQGLDDELREVLDETGDTR